MSGVPIARSALGTLSPLGSGGQGTVYTTQKKLRDLSLPLVYKEYKPGVLNGLDVSVLQSMPDYLESLKLSVGMELLSQASWPCRLVENDGLVTGFLMPAIPDEFYMTMYRSSGSSRVMGEFQHLLNDQGFLARRGILLSDQLRYQLLASVATALSVFHRHQINVGDLSPKNLLFSIGSDPKVYFVDCDAMRFKGGTVATQVETPGWEVRASNPDEELATPESDSFKLGLLALRLFAGDQSTRDLARIPDTVPKSVRKMIRAALDTDPASRPDAELWPAALQEAAAAASTEAPARPPEPPAKTKKHPKGVTPAVPRPGSPGGSTPSKQAKPASTSSGLLNWLGYQQAQKSTWKWTLLVVAIVIVVVLAIVIGADAASGAPSQALPEQSTTSAISEPASTSSMANTGQIDGGSATSNSVTNYGKSSIDSIKVTGELSTAFNDYFPDVTVAFPVPFLWPPGTYETKDVYHGQGQLISDSDPNHLVCVSLLASYDGATGNTVSGDYPNVGAHFSSISPLKVAGDRVGSRVVAVTASPWFLLGESWPTGITGPYISVFDILSSDPC